jgi:hypothetical protein
MDETVKGEITFQNLIKTAIRKRTTFEKLNTKM